MVYFMENPIKMDDLGGTIVFGNTHMSGMQHGEKPLFLDIWKGVFFAVMNV